MTQQETLISWLKDAHAMEVGAIPTLEDHASAAGSHPDLRAKLEEHASQTRKHAELVAGCLERLGEQPAVLKEAVGGIAGKVAGIANLPAKDTAVKNVLTDYAAESFEVACYTSLIATAQELGDSETSGVCRQILGDEQEMVSWLANYIPTVTQHYLSEQVASDTKEGRAGSGINAKTVLLTSGALIAGAGAALLASRAIKSSHNEPGLPTQYETDADDRAAAEQGPMSASSPHRFAATDLGNQNDESALVSSLLTEQVTDVNTGEDWLTPGLSSGMGPKAYEGDPNMSVQEAALRLTQHGQVDASDIEVAFEDGEITLRGTVASDEARQFAEDALRDLEGVNSVANELQVRV